MTCHKDIPMKSNHCTRGTINLENSKFISDDQLLEVSKAELDVAEKRTTCGDSDPEYSKSWAVLDDAYPVKGDAKPTNPILRLSHDATLKSNSVK
jgi:hypothetical protein